MEVGPGDWPEAARVMRETAHEVWRGGDDALAIRCLRRALREFPSDSPQRGDLLAALADVEQNADTSAMLRHVGQALPLLEAVPERAAVVARVPLTLFLSAPHAASEMLEQAGAGRTEPMVPTADPMTRAAPKAPEPSATSATSATSAMSAMSETSEAAELGLRLEARARLSRLGDPAARAAAVQRLRTLAPGRFPVPVPVPQPGGNSWRSSSSRASSAAGCRHRGRRAHAVATGARTGVGRLGVRRVRADDRLRGRRGGE
ncbi:hypothetical protein ACR6C2_13430 [Streptomyces sp. INA 01156]